MIVLDIEMSGLDLEKCGIWQIAAFDMETRKEFLDEARIDDKDLIIREVLIVTGKTEKELRDKNKQTQKQLIEKFFKWIEKRKLKTFVCQNPNFDVAFLTIKANKYGLKIPFHYRVFDLHSIAQIIYYQKNKKFLIEEDHSGMSLRNILEMCGIKDERVLLKDGKLIKQGKPHNALEDAKLEAECFSRLLNGKNLFPEYAKFKIPDYLKK